MDQTRGRYPHSFRACKSTAPYNPHYDANSHYNAPSNHEIFRSRIQKHSLKWRNDHYHRGNYRSKPPYKKKDITNKKTNKPAEDQEEEERKKKLNDTAKQLLNKIKTWNAEKNISEDDSQPSSIQEVISESSCRSNDEKSNTESKPKRIAHSKKAKLVKSRTCKSFSRPKTTVYDVNKDTVKDFQNRIQHKLIEEIMQMPKENLQNVLNDPKINPIMELKMSRLVRENKPLIAQKLRAIAESKMKSFDYPSNTQLLDDIDKLIDPVIETDLSVLPYELIKQMENIFQVQFDYAQSNSESQTGNDVSENPKDSDVIAEDFPVDINNLETAVKTEDLSVYECSTDEDEENSARKSIEFDSKSSSGVLCETEVKSEENKQKTYSEPIRSTTETDSSLLKVSVDKETPQRLEGTSATQCSPAENLLSSPEPIQNSSKSTVISCQTNRNFEEVATQTIPETLYGAPLPKEAINGTISSLLDEVNSIQTLTNKLNERRFMIFLELAKMNPSGSFISDDVTKINFIESVSNGDVYLVESLKQFLSVREKKNDKLRSNGSNLKRLNKNRTKNKKIS